MLQNIVKRVISIHIDFSASVKTSKVKHMFSPAQNLIQGVKYFEILKAYISWLSAKIFRISDVL